ncbi:MAG TPA: hypothetical protein VKJ45_18955 [Blastocatellia bacterium]|nr:hypothetical protein [Blastocatellia bacterium]
MSKEKTTMSKEKTTLLQRLTAMGKLKAPAGLQQSGEAGSANEYVTVSDWMAQLGPSGELSIGATLTPVSSPIRDITIYATASGVGKLAESPSASGVGTGVLSAGSFSLSSTTFLYDPSVDGNVIDSVIYGFVKIDPNTVVNFTFEKTFVV